MTTGRSCCVRAGMLAGTMLVLASLGSLAHAQSRFTLTEIEADAGLPSFMLEQSGLQNGIERELSTDASSDYLRRLANSVTFTQAGSGSDYSTPFEHLILNVGAGLGYQEGYAGYEDVLMGRESFDNLHAFSAQASISVGVKFHREQRSRFFLSCASADYSSPDLKAEIWGWGLLWQYDLWEASRDRSPLISWGGLRLGSGFRWNRFSSRYSKSLGPLQAQVKIPELGKVKASVQGDLDVAGHVKVMSVPLELGTSFRFMSVVTLYGVVGADAHFGQATGSVFLRGPISVELAASEDSSEKIKAQAQYTLDKSEDPDPFSFRALAGLQFELGHGSIFVQYQGSSLADSEAAALGFRAYF